MTAGRLELVWDREGGGETAFEALLRNAGTDPDAASGLALAYAALPDDAREQLITSIDATGPLASTDTNALLLLLGVEREPRIARRIAEALERGPEVGGQPKAAYGWGDLDGGGVAIFRPLHGEFADTLVVRWTDSSLAARPRFMDHAANLDAFRVTASLPDEAAAMPYEEAVDRLAMALWRHRRRGGTLPDSLRPFAELFSTPAHGAG